MIGKEEIATDLLDESLRLSKSESNIIANSNTPNEQT